LGHFPFSIGFLLKNRFREEEIAAKKKGERLCLVEPTVSEKNQREK
jgi:hypothetical protein